MDRIKDRNSKDLTEAEEIKKRWQEHRELHKKDLNDPENHRGMVTHLEPDILECEINWALGIITTNKASEGDRIPAEPFKILKDHAVKVLHSICQQTWKTQQWPQDWKRSIFIPIPKKGQFSFQSLIKASFNFMAAVTIHSDFGAQENKVCLWFHCFPIYLP